MRALCPSPHLARGGDSARPDLLRKVHSASRSRSPALCRIVASTRLLAAVTLHAPLGTASLALEHSRQGDTGRHFAAIRSHASQSCRVRRIAPRRAAISARRQPRSVRPQLHNPPRISSCRHPRTRARARSRVGTTLRALFFTLSLVFLRSDLLQALLRPPSPAKAIERAGSTGCCARRLRTPRARPSSTPSLIRAGVNRWEGVAALCIGALHFVRSASAGPKTETARTRGSSGAGLGLLDRLPADFPHGSPHSPRFRTARLRARVSCRCLHTLSCGPAHAPRAGRPAARACPAPPLPWPALPSPATSTGLLSLAQRARPVPTTRRKLHSIEPLEFAACALSPV